MSVLDTESAEEAQSTQSEMANDTDITEAIIGSAIEVHRSVGPGLLESAYETCLCHELELRKIPFRRQLEMPISYKGLELEKAYRIDLLVKERVVVELKAVDSLQSVHEAQLLTYMRFTEKQTGLLINFRAKLLKNGIKRMVL